MLLIGNSTGAATAGNIAQANNDSAWGQYTYQVPAVFQIPSSYSLPNFNLDGHNCLWRFYRDVGDKDIPERSSSSVMAASEFAQLMRLVHDTTILYYDGHESKVKAKGVLKQYQKYLEWKEELLDDIADIDDDDHMVPHVLSLQYCSRYPVLLRDALTFPAFNSAPPWFFYSGLCCTWKRFPTPPWIT